MRIESEGSESDWCDLSETLSRALCAFWGMYLLILMLAEIWFGTKGYLFAFLFQIPTFPAGVAAVAAALDGVPFKSNKRSD